jgi:hypothetical protein
MEKKRKVYAPFSLTSEAGVAQTPVEGYIDVNQTIYPTVNTGTVNENGKWTGVRSSDTEFKGLTKHEAIADGGETLNPATPSRDFIDMTGFNDMLIAIKPSNGGNYSIQAIMGPDTNRFANLEPVNAGAVLRGAGFDGRNVTVFESLVNDGVESLTADVWNIFMIGVMLQNQKNLQIRVTNNSGGSSNIEFGFMRLV